MANVPISNTCFLTADASGEGLEAWLSMTVKDMSKVEKEGNIMELTTDQG